MYHAACVFWLQIQCLDFMFFMKKEISMKVINSTKNKQIIKKNKLKGSVWYIYLKTETYCLKTFVKIHVGEKVCENTWNVVWRLKMIVWKYKPNTPQRHSKNILSSVIKTNREWKLSKMQVEPCNDNCSGNDFTFSMCTFHYIPRQPFTKCGH